MFCQDVERHLFLFLRQAFLCAFTLSLDPLVAFDWEPLVSILDNNSPYALRSHSGRSPSEYHWSRTVAASLYRYDGFCALVWICSLTACTQQLPHKQSATTRLTGLHVKSVPPQNNFWNSPKQSAIRGLQGYTVHTKGAGLETERFPSFYRASEICKDCEDSPYEYTPQRTLSTYGSLSQIPTWAPRLGLVFTGSEFGLKSSQLWTPTRGLYV